MSTWAKQQNNEESRAVNKEISCGLCSLASCGHCQPNWEEAGSLTRLLRVPQSSRAPQHRTCTGPRSPRIAPPSSSSRLWHAGGGWWSPGSQGGAGGRRGGG